MNLFEYKCEGCDSVWMAPPPSEKEWWEELARSYGGLLPQKGVMDWLKANTNLPEWDIKVIVSHFPWNVGKCNGCSWNIEFEGYGICRNCRTLNYNYLCGVGFAARMGRAFKFIVRSVNYRLRCR